MVKGDDYTPKRKAHSRQQRPAQISLSGFPGFVVHADGGPERGRGATSTPVGRLAQGVGHVVCTEGYTRVPQTFRVSSRFYKGSGETKHRHGLMYG